MIESSDTYLNDANSRLTAVSIIESCFWATDYTNSQRFDSTQPTTNQLPHQLTSQWNTRFTTQLTNPCPPNHRLGPTTNSTTYPTENLHYRLLNQYLVSSIPISSCVCFHSQDNSTQGRAIEKPSRACCRVVLLKSRTLLPMWPKVVSCSK